LPLVLPPTASKLSSSRMNFLEEIVHSGHASRRKALLRLFEALEAARAVGGARELISNERSVDVKSVLARRDPCSRESGTIHLS
jgi:hypothetical protein